MCMSWKATQKNVKTFTVSNSNWFLSHSNSDCSLPWFHVDQKYPFNIPLQINLVQLYRYAMRIALMLSHIVLKLVMFSFLLLNMQTHNSISIETLRRVYISRELFFIDWFGTQSYTNFADAILIDVSISTNRYASALCILFFVHAETAHQHILNNVTRHSCRRAHRSHEYCERTGVSIVYHSSTFWIHTRMAKDFLFLHSLHVLVIGPEFE